MDRSEDWLRQAGRDLQAGHNSSAAGYHEWAALAAQQCAEKAVKALIAALHGAERGHSVLSLLEQLRDQVSLPEPVLDAAKELDQVYIAARYPSGFASGAPADYFTEKTSDRLLTYARTVLEFCRSQIPESRPGAG